MDNESPDVKWAAQVARLREMYPFLDNDDFAYDYGMRDVMLNKLQAGIGKDREELNELLNTLTSEEAESPRQD